MQDAIAISTYINLAESLIEEEPIKHKQSIMEKEWIEHVKESARKYGAEMALINRGGCDYQVWHNWIVKKSRGDFKVVYVANIEGSVK